MCGGLLATVGGGVAGARDVIGPRRLLRHQLQRSPVRHAPCHYIPRQKPRFYVEVRSMLVGVLSDNLVCFDCVVT